MHSIAVLADGRLFAVGKNDHGQLGTGDTGTRKEYVPISFPGKASVAKISMGRSHTMFLLSSGELWACGSNSFGQLGLGNSKATAKDVLTPMKLTIPGDDPVVRDVACGYDFTVFCTLNQGRVYAFGHPEYGVLGQGTEGKYIRDGGKGAAIQFSCEYTPQLVDRFLTKDAHDRVTTTLTGSQVKVRAVAAGKNHVVCLEDWEGTDSHGAACANRVYSWGWGGYGRLGHNGAKDELYPREVQAFSQSGPSPTDPSVHISVAPTNRQKQVREVVCGSAFTLAVSETRHLYYFGKMSNAPRGEATMHPQLVQELFDYPVRQCAAGSNLVVVVAGRTVRGKPASEGEGPSYAIAWGMPVAGKLGFEDGAKSSRQPKLLSRLDGVGLTSVSCGYGHVHFIAQPGGSKSPPFPVIDATPKSAEGTSSGGAGGNKRKKASLSEGSQGAAAKKGKK